MIDVTKDLLGALRRIAAINASKNAIGAMMVCSEIARAAIGRAEAALDHSADIPSSVDERRLRRMLCRQRHGLSAYMDDGEAAFGGDEFQRPTDYLRESLDSIEQAWIEAGLKQAALAAPQPAADGWIPWAGCECPVDEKVLVEVKLRSGSAWIDQEAQMGADWLWDHDGGPLDIIAYRVVKR